MCGLLSFPPCWPQSVGMVFRSLLSITGNRDNFRERNCVCRGADGVTRLKAAAQLDLYLALDFQSNSTHLLVVILSAAGLVFSARH